MRDDHISLEDVRKVARLARLALPDEELARLQKDLESILRYVEKLEELDVSSVEPLTHAVPLSMPMRDDHVRKSLPHEELMKNAPDRDNGSFRVPLVVGD